METVQQNGRFILFSSKFHSNIYFILFGLGIRRFLTFQTLNAGDSVRYRNGQAP